MKTIITVIITLFCLATTCCAEADVKDTEKSYNYLRGMEYLDKEDFQKAIEYFNKELSENPKNGIIWSCLSISYFGDGKPGMSLDAINKAIKYLPKKNKVGLSKAYLMRSDIHAKLGDSISAIQDLNTAIGLDPEEIENYGDRGQLLFEMGKLKESDADFKKMVELSPGNVIGHMGLGRNANAEGNYDYAIEKFTHVTNLLPDYSSAWAFRAESHRLKKEYNEAAEDAIAALRMDYSQKGGYELRRTAESAFQLVEIKLKAQQKRAPQESYWPYMLASIHQDHGDHAQAVSYYLKASELDDNPTLLVWASLEAQEMGDYDQAISLVTRAYERDTTKNVLLHFRSRMENYAGYTDAALADINRYIDLNPEESSGYHFRGWIKDKNHISCSEAMDDYSTAILLDPNESYSYLCRGQIYLNQGEQAKADSDFEKVLELDTTYTSGNSHAAQYALFYLGRKEEAKAWMDSILVNDKDVGNLYDASCLYSLMNELDTSIDYLRKALEAGYSSFAHIRRDDDMNNVRQHPDYIPLMEKYEDRHRKLLNGLKSMEESPVSLESAVIPFSRENGVCRVNCSINGLPLYFVFDTGASDVTLSMVEANFMLKNDYLSRQDLSGSRYYMTADGSISEGTSVVLKEVNFGGVTLHNVKASVVKNQKAPLLLGQSVLARLGRIEIDNKNRKILVNNPNQQ